MTVAPGANLLNRSVSRTLSVASGLAAAILVVGIATWLAVGMPQPAERNDPGRWFELGSIGVMGAGLLLVTFTPLVQLAAALFAFARLGERREAAMTAVVLAILVASAVAAGALGLGR